MIVLFTDFGWQGPYVGQLKIALAAAAPNVPVVDLMHDAPRFDPRGAAYLLPAYCGGLAPGSVVLAVVDPGVGSARRAVAVHLHGIWYVGPDNGLLSGIGRQPGARAWHLPIGSDAAPTFHGRDVFAPAAALLAQGGEVPGSEIEPASLVGAGWPDDLAEVVYVDYFGNAITGMNANRVDPAAEILVNGHRLKRLRTFAEAAVGEGFWYANSSGLLEFAVNQGRADQSLGAVPGTHFRIGHSL